MGCGRGVRKVSAGEGSGMGVCIALCSVKRLGGIK